MIVKRIFSLIVFLGGYCTLLFTQIQNPNWIVPPNFIKFQGNQLTLTAIPNAPPEFYVAAASYDDSGMPLFWIIDNEIFDGNGNKLINELYSQPTSVVVTNVPKQCDKYYIIYSRRAPMQGCDLYYSTLQATSQSNTVVLTHNNSLGKGPYEDCNLCLSKLVSNSSRLLLVGGGGGIHKYELNTSGIYNKGEIYQNPSLSGYETEMELSPNNKLLAIPINTGNGVYVLDLDNEFNVLSDKLFTLPTTITSGLEFSADNTKLFVSAGYPSPSNPSVDGVYKIDLSIPSNNISLIAGTYHLRGSALELASDGLLYAISSSNTLCSINPNNLSIVNNLTIVHGGPPWDYITKLPNQIDGMDYSAHSGEMDLVVMDDYLDLGKEPNLQSSDIWQGNIWNCRHDPTCASNEEAEYKSSNNYLRTTIKNIGCRASSQSELYLYWTIARTNELWDEHWTNNAGNYINGVLAGSELPPKIIPTLNPGQEITITQQWSPPNPYSFGLNSPPTICYLARIISNADLMFSELPGPIAYNVGSNNNVATRNSELITLIANENPSVEKYIIMNNPYEREIIKSIELIQDYPPRKPFSRIGNLKFEVFSIDREIRSLNLMTTSKLLYSWDIKSKGKKLKYISRNITVPPLSDFLLVIEIELERDKQLKRNTKYKFTIRSIEEDASEHSTHFVYFLDVLAGSSHK